MNVEPLGDERKDTHLLHVMGKVVELDFSRALDAGALDNEDWVGMVTSCRGCEWVNGCRKWLRSARRGDECPMRCRNRAHLARLSDNRNQIA